MKNLFLLPIIAVFAMCILSCSDESSIEADTLEEKKEIHLESRSTCPYYFVPVAGEPCDMQVNFSFIDESGKEFTYQSKLTKQGTLQNNFGLTPRPIYLTPGSYSLCINSFDGPENCEGWEWIFANDHFNCDASIGHNLDSRPDTCDPENPDYVIHIPEDCGCPTIASLPDPEDPEPGICFCRCTFETPEGIDKIIEYEVDCDAQEACENSPFNCKFIRG